MSKALMTNEHDKNRERDLEIQTHYLLNPRWWTVCIIYVFGMLLELSSLFFLRLNFLVLIITVGVVISILYHVWFRKDVIAKRDHVILTVIFFGLILAILISNKTTNYPKGPFLTVPILIKTLTPPSPPFFYILFLLTTPCLIGFIHFCRPRAYFAGSLPAWFGALSMICCKVIIDLVVSSSLNQNQFTYFFAWIFVFLVIPLITIQNYLIQSFLSNFDYILPTSIYFINYFILCYSGGVLVFDEWKDESILQTIIYFIGMMMTLVGVFLLSYFHSREESMYPVTEKNKGGHIKLANVGKGSQMAC
jgi:hypothetical protein